MSTLPFHLHDRTVFAVILEGSFESRFQGASYDCPPDTILTEPVGEKHGNRFEQKGARVLVIQPDPKQVYLLEPLTGLLDRVNHFQDHGIARVARSLAQELRYPDAVSPLSIEGLGLEMLATAMRRQGEPHRIPPGWLVRAEELMRARFLDSLCVEEIARAVDIHPVHLARVFRTYYRVPIGTFLRRLRLDWAASQLATAPDHLADIALQAGFADQSHFTRVFKKYTGVTPGHYRRVLRA
ncbi:MAG TPA: AraC family transcriptional regulator [Rhodothermales bacterium]|nr:AraC family transcriptional regulator [Rhodothermales bacterium]